MPIEHMKYMGSQPALHSGRGQWHPGTVVSALILAVPPDIPSTLAAPLSARFLCVFSSRVSFGGRCEEHMLEMQHSCNESLYSN